MKNTERDVDLTIEELRDQIDQFDKVQELADEGMEGWDKLIHAATQTTLASLKKGKCDLCEEYDILCPICESCLQCHNEIGCGIPCWPEDD